MAVVRAWRIRQAEGQQRMEPTQTAPGLALGECHAVEREWDAGRDARQEGCDFGTAHTRSDPGEQDVPVVDGVVLDLNGERARSGRCTSLIDAILCGHQGEHRAAGRSSAAIIGDPRTGRGSQRHGWGSRVLDFWLLSAHSGR